MAAHPASWPLRNRRMDWQSPRHDVSGLKKWPAIQRRRSWLGGKGWNVGIDSSEVSFRHVLTWTVVGLDMSKTIWTRQDDGERSDIKEDGVWMTAAVSFQSLADGFSALPRAD